MFRLKSKVQRVFFSKETLKNYQPEETKATYLKSNNLKYSNLNMKLRSLEKICNEKDKGKRDQNSWFWDAPVIFKLINECIMTDTMKPDYRPKYYQNSIFLKVTFWLYK